MTDTAQTLIDRCRDLLMSGHREVRNKLADSYTAGSGTLTFSYDLNAVSAGAALSAGLNTFYVWDTDPTSKSATVSGGENGSVDADLASGATVRVNPKFTDHQIFAALNDELNALSAAGNNLYQVKTLDLTYNFARTGYDLTGATDLMSVYEIRYQTPGPYKDWPRFKQWEWRLDRSDPTTDFTSGFSLQLFPTSATPYQGKTVRVVYKAPFTTFAATSDSVASTGLPATAYDLPVLGAAVALMAPREVKRNFTEAQGDTRRASEVPPGAVQASWQGLAQRRAQRIQEEASRLARAYPVEVE